MKNFYPVIVFGLALLVNISAAHAFSTEQSTAQSSDGSAKFSDPDEHMPAFMVGPTNGNTSNGAVSFGAPTTNMPTIGETDNGAQAFDQAYAHQQVKQ